MAADPVYSPWSVGVLLLIELSHHSMTPLLHHSIIPLGATRTDDSPDIHRATYSTLGQFRAARPHVR